MTTKLVCAKCDRKAGKGMKFCPRCGGELVPVSSDETPKILTADVVEELKTHTPEADSGMETFSVEAPKPASCPAVKVKEATVPRDEAYEDVPSVEPEAEAKDFFDHDHVKTLRLEAISGPCAGTAARISNGDMATIGATAAATLFLEEDKCVSRRHAVVSFEDGRVFVKDTGSLNGSYIKICGEVEVMDSAILLVGKTLIQLNLEK